MTAPKLQFTPDVDPDHATERSVRQHASRLRLVPALDDEAERGMPHIFCGEVLHGQKLGRTIGFPTANIALSGGPPAIGIYAAEVRLQDGRTRRAVAYYGDRPTVDGFGELLEVFLFGFNEEIYGQKLDVELVAFIRGDMTFASLEAMTRQIAADCIEAAALLASYQKTLMRRL